MKKRQCIPILVAVLAALPGTVIRLAGVHLDPPLMAVISGMAILGASFLLLWACDAAQADISPTLALAVVALIAVLPEYAVDMYFTWQAGKYPESNYAHYAIANMTGANRLLIGVAWGAIAAIFWFRFRRDVRIDKERRTELFFLALATLYAFVIPGKGSLAWYDGLVFLALYVWYIVLASRRPAEEYEAEGPAELLTRLPVAPRRLTTLLMLLLSAGAILANAEHFCEGLVDTGKMLRIKEFLLVQWLAPVASEAPEFIVALMFAWRGRGGMALGSLLSSKLNQWTLLMGMIPGVFAISHRSLAHPLPMGTFQMHEILLTAAQSLLGVVLLASMRLTLWGTLLLFGLFAGQLVLPGVVEAFPNLIPGMDASMIHPLFSTFYLVAAVAIFLQMPRRLLHLWKGARVSVEDPASGPSPATSPARQIRPTAESLASMLLRNPDCADCPLRLSMVEGREHAAQRALHARP